MKVITKNITILLFLTSLFFLIHFTLPSRLKHSFIQMNNSVLTIEVREEFTEGKSSKYTRKKKKSKHTKIKYITKSKLLDHIAKTESKGNYSVANKSLYLGKYQAGKNALIDFGYSEEYINSIYSTIDTTYSENGKAHYSFNTSLFPPSEQERFIRWFMNHMETIYLKQTINKYVGKEINGINITKAGILNASMLGFSHVKRYLESNGKVNYSPQNGPSIKTRLKQFEKVDIKSGK